MSETTSSQYLENSIQGEVEKPRRARGEFVKLVEKIFKEYHSKLVALAKYKLIDAGTEENEAANLAEDMVSLLYKDILDHVAHIDERKTELEIQADLAKLLQETISRYLRIQNAEKRIPSSELLQVSELTEKENSQISAQDDYLEAICNVPLAEILKEDLAQISPRRRKVLKMRFGIPPYDKAHTLEEVALEFDVTRERIRQIEASALRSLRQVYEARQMREARSNQAIYTKKLGLASQRTNLEPVSQRTEKVAVEIVPETLKMSVDMIDLGPRVTASFQKACRAKNIETIAQLITHSRMSLYTPRVFSDIGLDALEQWLEQRGLHLRKKCWDMTDEELLHSPEGLKQDWDIEFNLEVLFIKISDIKEAFLKSEPTHGEQIISLLEGAGKKTVFDLLESDGYSLEEALNNNYDLLVPLQDFFQKNYKIRVGYCSPGELEQITRWYNAKLKLK